MIFQNAEQSEKTCVKMLWLSNHCVCQAARPQEAPLLSEHDGDQAKPTQLSGFSGINTASSCDGPACCLPALVAGSFQLFDLGSVSDPFTADSLQYVSTQPAIYCNTTPTTCIWNPYMHADTFCSDTFILTH